LTDKGRVGKGGSRHCANEPNNQGELYDTLP